MVEPEHSHLRMQPDQHSTDILNDNITTCRRGNGPAMLSFLESTTLPPSFSVSSMLHQTLSYNPNPNRTSRHCGSNRLDTSRPLEKQLCTGRAVTRAVPIKACRTSASWVR
ncbi:hypothetical protein J3458_009527 [Metarhizium acridum]|uniref:uncharacterized protein n=1 Tax=Metarhizium acridum TaxID=92637 RepID=UPI001C6CEA17|nr:hypothetical protein J3458_009527 [Metarhizium acridum]